MRKRTKKKQFRVAVLKENLMAVTKNDVCSALILNQLLYWTDKAEQDDENLLDLIERAEERGDKKAVQQLEQNFRNGWFFKSAKKLADEIMGFSRPTVQKRLQQLEKDNFLFSKPGEREDFAKHYKVNLDFLKQELHKHGYTLTGFLEELEEVPERGTNPEDKKGEQIIPCSEGTREHTDPCSERTTPVPTEQPPVLSEHQENTYRRIHQENTGKEQQQPGEQPAKEKKNVVVEVQSAWKDSFGTSLPATKARLLLKDAKQESKSVMDAIKKVKRLKKDNNPIGAVRYELQYGWDEVPEKKDKPAPAGSQKNDDLDGLPSAFQKEAMTDEEKQKELEVDPEIQAQLEARLYRMRERLEEAKIKKKGVFAEKA